MFRKRVNSIGLAVLLTIATLALSQAGPLEPAAPPGPTMKTLDEVPPTWSQIIPDERRYVVVLDGTGVLDKETGLVWDRAPKYTIQNEPGAFDWLAAQTHCALRDTGGGANHRGGWRLPSAAEMSSLGSFGRVSSDLTPFDFDCSDGNCVTAAFYWTSTTVPSFPNSAFVGNPAGGVSSGPKTSLISAWCVRGGFSADSGR